GWRRMFARMHNSHSFNRRREYFLSPTNGFERRLNLRSRNRRCRSMCLIGFLEIIVFHRSENCLQYVLMFAIFHVREETTKIIALLKGIDDECLLRCIFRTQGVMSSSQTCCD